MQLAADRKGLRDAIVFPGPTQEPLGSRRPKVSPGNHCAQTLLRLDGTVQDEDCAREAGEGRGGMGTHCRGVNVCSMESNTLVGLCFLRPSDISP